MNPSKLRDSSKKLAIELGYSPNDNLPLLDPFEHHSRSLDEATDRLLCLHTVVACSYGFSKERAAQALRTHGLLDSLTPKEGAYLNAESDGYQHSLFQWQVESLWALAWCLRVHDDLDFGKPCGTNLASLLPDLKLADPKLQAFRDTLSLRNPNEILTSADLAYCLHWSTRDAQLHKRPIPGLVQAGVMAERRRALDWVMSREPWDEVVLDT